jgi:hypothetical protein
MISIFFLQTEKKSFLFILATLGDFAEHAQFCWIFITEPFCWKKLTFCLTQTVIFSLGIITNVCSEDVVYATLHTNILSLHVLFASTPNFLVCSHVHTNVLVCSSAVSQVLGVWILMAHQKLGVHVVNYWCAFRLPHDEFYPWCWTQGCFLSREQLHHEKTIVTWYQVTLLSFGCSFKATPFLLSI